MLGQIEHPLKTNAPRQKTTRNISKLSPAERQRLVVEWNQTWTDYPRNQGVPELFETEASEHPDRIAAICGVNHLTYGELDARANQMASYLMDAGVGPGSKVGLCLNRGLDLLIAILGALKAGAAYAPLGSRSPPDRLAGMLQDLQVPLVLTHRSFQDLLSAAAHRGIAPAARIICLDTAWPRIQQEPTRRPGLRIGPEDLAYISFTSGSTGRPKGVCVPHRGIVRLVRNTNYASFAASEVFLQSAPVSFDASLFEIWGSLLNGARLVLSPSPLPTLSELAELIREQGITTAWFTTGLFNQLVDEVPEALRALNQILTGGEVASPFHVRQALGVLRHGRLINAYGPTENSTFSTTFTIPADFDGARPVPIGRPIANSTCYILDRNHEPVPIGAMGELFVGGDGLAEGYLNRPQRTIERFVANPFQPGSRLYRTGDAARYLPDGNIEFLGRMDLQVKIRGFRVEPGEIESRLLQHPAVHQCVVAARRDATGLKQLVAYLVAENPPEAAPNQWHAFLQQRLPDYMVPSFFVQLERLPLTPNGKVDYNALPVPNLRARRSREDTQPKNALQARLQELWEELLQTRPIGIRDNFFALGGHSLLAMRLAAEIEKRWGKNLPVPAIFANPTIAQLAEVLQAGRRPESPSALVELQPKGTRPALLLVHGAGGGMFWGYRNLARYLGEDQPVLVFKSRGLEGASEPESIGALADSYVAALRRFQPAGPYYLGGYCFGGLVAYEIARRLERAAHPVAFLGLINTSPPNSSYNAFSWTPGSLWKFIRNAALKTAYALPHTWADSRKLLRWETRRLLHHARRLAKRSETLAATAEQWTDLSGYSTCRRQLWQKHIRAWTAYRPQPYGGQVTLFRSNIHQLYCSFDSTYGWGELAQGGVQVHVIPGGHDTIMAEPRVQRLGATYRAALECAQALAAKSAR